MLVSWSRSSSSCGGSGEGVQPGVVKSGSSGGDGSSDSGGGASRGHTWHGQALCNPKGPCAPAESAPRLRPHSWARRTLLLMSDLRWLRLIGSSNASASAERAGAAGSGSALAARGQASSNQDTQLQDYNLPRSLAHAQRQSVPPNSPMHCQRNAGALPPQEASPAHRMRSASPVHQHPALRWSIGGHHWPQASGKRYAGAAEPSGRHAADTNNCTGLPAVSSLVQALGLEWCPGAWWRRQWRHRRHRACLPCSPTCAHALPWPKPFYRLQAVQCRTAWQQPAAGAAGAASAVHRGGRGGHRAAAAAAQAAEAEAAAEAAAGGRRQEGRAAGDSQERGLLTVCSRPPACCMCGEAAHVVMLPGCLAAACRAYCLCQVALLLLRCHIYPTQLAGLS